MTKHKIQNNNKAQIPNFKTLVFVIKEVLNMSEIKFEGAGATNKEHRLARPPRCEAGRSTKILFPGGIKHVRNKI